MTPLPPGPTPEDLTCQELVELVTEYLEGALAPEGLARFRRHLDLCPPCDEYVEQIRRTIRLAGSARAEPITPAERDRLAAMFRGWKGA